MKEGNHCFFQGLYGCGVLEDFCRSPAKARKETLSFETNLSLSPPQALRLKSSNPEFQRSIYEEEFRKKGAETCFKEHRPLNSHPPTADMPQASSDFEKEQGMREGIQEEKHSPVPEYDLGKLSPL